MTDSVVKGAAGFSVRAFEGDAKTLLAFDMPQELATNLAGFTIAVEPPGQPAYFIENNLRYATPGEHSQDPAQPANSSVNAPLHKFRWVHVPGAATGADPTFGTYAYTVTPRFADGAKKLLPLDPGAGVTSHVSVAPFSTGKLHAAFTRGYVQSQAYVNRFGPKPRFRPAGKDLLFDTSAQAGIDPAGPALNRARGAGRREGSRSRAAPPPRPRPPSVAWLDAFAQAGDRDHELFPLRGDLGPDLLLGALVIRHGCLRVPPACDAPLRARPRA